MARRRYVRDNRGRFASTGATSRGGRLKTASGKKRETQTMKASGGPMSKKSKAASQSAPTKSSGSTARSGKGGTGLTRVNQNIRRTAAGLESLDPKVRAKARRSQTTARKAKEEWLDKAGRALAKAGRGSRKYA